MPRPRPSPRSRTPIGRILGIGGAALLLGSLGYQSWDASRRAPGDDAVLTEFEVDGLDCPVWCSVRLSEAIDDLDGAAVVRIDRESGEVLVRHDPKRQDEAALRSVLEYRGFPVREVRHP